MKSELRRSMLAIGALMGIVLAAYPIDAGSEASSSTLAAPESFASIADEGQRSAAYFAELGKVLLHPRCVNCHPTGDRPRQGDLARLHQPPVERGADGSGVPGMRCSSCHQAANFGRVPGHPDWHLAPVAMAWEGKSLSQICAQIKDSKRNGGRSLADLMRHIGDDSLVGWAWDPGVDRQPAPGTQKEAGALVEAWAKTGAACP
jgi:hypothetical protein